MRSTDANDAEWDETRQWVDELHRLNSSFSTHEPPPQLSMTKDSLGGTIDPIFQPVRDKDDERILPIHIDASQEQPVPKDHQRPPTPPPSRLASSAGSHRSPRPPSVRASVTSVASKITYDDVCEALKKLEEVEQFPPQPDLPNDSFSDTSTLSEASRSSTPRIVGPTRSLVLRTPPKEKNPLNRNVRSTQDFRDKLKQWKSQDRPDSFQQQLEAQKQAYQQSIEQHIRFLDEVRFSRLFFPRKFVVSSSQVNEDKKKLVARCDVLENQLKTTEKKYENQIRTLEFSHRLEIQRFKDQQALAEKSRRDKWIEDKSRKFKELTVQNLEPEIQKFIEKHQKEIAELREIHQAELTQADVKASERYIRLTDELREELEREKQTAVARERELAREKYEKAIRDERESFVEQRKKLFAEVEEEKRRQTDLLGKQRAELEK